jgi:hypothetical protein
MASIEVNKNPTYTLTLNTEELNTLYLVLGCIGGSISDSPRCYTEGLYSTISPHIVVDHADFTKLGTLEFKPEHLKILLGAIKIL